MADADLSLNQSRLGDRLAGEVSIHDTAVNGEPVDGVLSADESAEPDRLAQLVDHEQSPRLPFPVVGIGASAGGLEAAIEFFDAMPSESGIAFVLISIYLRIAKV